MHWHLSSRPCILSFRAPAPYAPQSFSSSGINTPLERVWSVGGTGLLRKLWVVHAEATDKRLEYIVLCTRYVLILALTVLNVTSHFRSKKK